MRPIHFTLLFTWVFSLLACRQEPISDTDLPDPTLPLPDCRLLEKYPKNGFQKYAYEYDSSGRLVRQFELWNNTLRTWIALRYSNEKLVAREYWNAFDPTMIRMTGYDTLFYNAGGLVEKVWRLDPEENFSLQLVDDFTYDSVGHPITCRTYFPKGNEYWAGIKYFWEKGNIAKLEYYSDDFVTLHHEAFYKYTAGINPERLTTVTPETPFNQNSNLLKEASAVDYSGKLDLACNPCKYQYELNDWHVPGLIKHVWDGEVVLVWDCR